MTRIPDKSWFACLTGDCDHNTEAECNQWLGDQLVEIARENETLRTKLEDEAREFERWEAYLLTAEEAVAVMWWLPSVEEVANPEFRSGVAKLRARGAEG